MLAVCTTNTLVVIDGTTLRKPSNLTSTPSAAGFTTLGLENCPTASSWATDNSCLFLASGCTISKYDNLSGSLEPSASSVVSSSNPVLALVSKEKGSTLLYSSQNEITVVDVASGKIAYKLDSHEREVTLLSLSNDATLLASSSIGGDVHIHNLSQASHTVLEGIPATAGTEITALTFHIHSRSKLLLAIGSQLLVYDTLKPEKPIKTVALDKAAGRIVAITCSPFSKSLVAVACDSGSICLVDLEKEKGLFRTLSLYVSVTSMCFSAEGAALYIGTENGKVLIMDLRALDKPAKLITVSSDGLRVICMSVQRKLKPGEGATRTPLNTTPIKRRLMPVNSGPALLDKKGLPTSSSSPGEKPKGPPSTRIRTTSTTGAVKTRAPQSSVSAEVPKSTPPTPSGSRVRPLPNVASRAAAAGPPVRVRTISAASAVSSPSSRVTSSSRASRALSSATSVTSFSPSVSGKASGSGASPRKVFSPPKSPLGRSGTDDESEAQPESLINRLKARKPAKEDHATDGTAKPGHVSSRSVAINRTRTTSDSATSPRARVPSGAGRAASGSGTRLPTSRTASGSSVDKPPSSSSTIRANDDRPRTRTRTLSSHSGASRAVPAPATQPLHVRPQSQAQARVKSVLSPTPTLSPIPPVPPLPAQYRGEDEQLTAINLNLKWAGAMSRTPSPDFAALPAVPGISVNGAEEVVKTLVHGTVKERVKQMEKGAARRTNSLGVDALGLGTPEVRRWVQAGHIGTDDDDEAVVPASEEIGGKKVDLVEEPENEVFIESIEVMRDDRAKNDGNSVEEGGARGDRLEEPMIKMTVQISPRRPTGSTTGQQWPSIDSPYNVLKNAQLPGGPGTSYQPNAHPAHDLLHTLIRDALYDFRRETKAEIIGLHVDLVKMGRGWRKEMREALDTWGKELQTIKAENELLRQENERLRRGY